MNRKLAVVVSTVLAAVKHRWARREHRAAVESTLLLVEAYAIRPGRPA